MCLSSYLNRVGELQTKATFFQAHSLHVHCCYAEKPGVLLVTSRNNCASLVFSTVGSSMAGASWGRWDGIGEAEVGVARKTCVLCFELISCQAKHSNVFPMCWILDTKLFIKFKGRCNM